MAVMEPEPNAGIEEHDLDEVVLMVAGCTVAVKSHADVGAERRSP